MPQALGSETPKFNDSVYDVSDEERSARFEEAWNRGGTLFMASFNDVLVDETANTMPRILFGRKFPKSLRILRLRNY